MDQEIREMSGTLIGKIVYDGGKWYARKPSGAKIGYFDGTYTRLMSGRAIARGNILAAMFFVNFD